MLSCTDLPGQPISQRIMNASVIPLLSLGNIWPNSGTRPHGLTNDDICILKQYLDDQVEIVGTKCTGRETTVSSKIDKMCEEEMQAVILLGH